LLLFFKKKFFLPHRRRMNAAFRISCGYSAHMQVLLDKD